MGTRKTPNASLGAAPALPHPLESIREQFGLEIPGRERSRDGQTSNNADVWSLGWARALLAPGAAAPRSSCGSSFSLPLRIFQGLWKEWGETAPRRAGAWSKVPGLSSGASPNPRCQSQVPVPGTNPRCQSRSQMPIPALTSSRGEQPHTELDSRAKCQSLVPVPVPGASPNPRCQSQVPVPGASPSPRCQSQVPVPILGASPRYQSQIPGANPELRCQSQHWPAPGGDSPTKSWTLEQRASPSASPRCQSQSQVPVPGASPSPKCQSQVPVPVPGTNPNSRCQSQLQEPQPHPERADPGRSRLTV
ncbi:uncharacterized protein LOC134561271 [Prinia subflava]|uniref:uncharacterized protein LOC134561271 n=1 Tax=Prinia subflava TaxID=208062 RepID=UPI002FE1EB38